MRTRSSSAVCRMLFALAVGGPAAVSASADPVPNCAGPPLPPAPQADWTVMVFLNADNNLEQAGLLNFRQMARVDNTPRVNVLVQFDRIGRFANTTPQWTQTLRFRVGKGMEPLPAYALQDICEANMGDGAVLEAFVRWSLASFPANHYMLVIWDHGQGWRGVIPDSDAMRMLLRRPRARRESGIASRVVGPSPHPGASPAPAAGEDTCVLGSPFRSSFTSPFKTASMTSALDASGG
jgi:hypothetical protein